MEKLKFLHCADLHLDMPFTSLNSDNRKSELRRGDLKSVFNNIIEIAKENSVDVLLISGDLYEHKYVKKSVINYINDRFVDISGIDVFIVPGNHDPYLLKSFYKDYKWNANVHILNDDNPFFLLDRFNACIYGAGFDNFTKSNRNLNNFDTVNENLINILLFHGTVDLKFNQELYNNISSEDLNKLNMDYIALGHFHNRIDDIGGYGYIYNPGSPEPLGFDEEGEHGIIIGTIEKNSKEISRKLSYIKTSIKYYRNISIDVNGCNNDEQAIKMINEELKARESSKEKLTDGLFLVTLKGFCEKGFKFDIKYIESGIQKDVFFIKIKDQTRMDYDLEDIMKEPGLRGLFTRKLMEEINGTENEHDKELLGRALYYGLDALDRGKVEI